MSAQETSIKAQRALERALQESEEKWRSLVENAPHIILLVGRDGVIQFINHTVPGLRAEDVIGRSQYDFISPEYHRLVRDTVEAVFETGKPGRYEVAGTGPDGTTAWYETFVGSVRSGDRIVAATLMTYDITNRKRVERALRESEERFRSIFDNATDGILLADSASKRFVMANETICAKLGYSEQELLALRVEDLHPKDDLPRVMEVFEQQARRELTLAPDVPMLRKDKSVFYADVNASPVTVDGHNCLMGIFRDIAERRRMEEHLTRSQEELRDLYARLNQAREEERAKVAREIHDGLGQSLAVLSMQLELLRAQPPAHQEAATRKFLSMADLVEGCVAEMRRICAELRPGVLDHLGLSPAIEWQAQEFMERTGIQCRVTTDLEDEALDNGVAAAVFRILQESLTNVARHAEAQGVWVSCAEKEGWVELVVSDDGKGIPDKRAVDPKSLGLAGMRERAREMGGTIDITGVSEEGTTVTVRVPTQRRSVRND